MDQTIPQAERGSVGAQYLSCLPRLKSAYTAGCMPRGFSVTEVGEQDGSPLLGQFRDGPAPIQEMVKGGGFVRAVIVCCLPALPGPAH